ncbi:MAG: NYN domain-containing protein [Kofleriaceae bacterium]
MSVKVNVYVDGFNLYYRALKSQRAADGSLLKWLDLNKLVSALLPAYTIGRIRYFTAQVIALPSDPDAPQRQQIYFRALRTLPNVSIHLGYFSATKKWARLVTPLPDGTKTVQVHKTEEKGSDVNLASYLLLDGFNNDYDEAAVITNDSDLVEPIRIVRDSLKKPVLVLEPRSDGRRSKELKDVSTNQKPIRVGVLSASQFPPTLTDAVGTFRKPPSW